MHTKGNSTMLRYSALMTALLICFPTVWCAADDIKLRFPEDRNCGTVSMAPQPTVSQGWTIYSEQRQFVGNARGVRTVPHDAFVELKINRAGAADLSFLNALPADGVH